MELASWVESFLRRRLFVDLLHLSLNGFMLTSQQLLIDNMHQDRADFLVKQLGGGFYCDRRARSCQGMGCARSRFALRRQTPQERHRLS
eukprot:1557536-Pyramimonas_sp.AAC.1